MTSSVYICGPCRGVGWVPFVEGGTPPPQSLSLSLHWFTPKEATGSTESDRPHHKCAACLGSGLTTSTTHALVPYSGAPPEPLPGWGLEDNAPPDGVLAWVCWLSYGVYDAVYDALVLLGTMAGHH